MSETVIGVDGCPGGWISVIWNGQSYTARLFLNFTELLDANQQLKATTIAVDMPIGLPRLHGRTAEREARRLLGTRSSSVFPTPSRAAFIAKDWPEACKINLKNSEPPRKLSKQSFGLFEKINELDCVLRNSRTQLVREVHPEVSFCEMNKLRPLAYSKKKKQGREERLTLLVANGFPNLNLEREYLSFNRAKVARDDLVDAFACAWSARRIHRGVASSYPAHEERDEHGLLMRIHA